MSLARAVAHPNIALAKYWGKRASSGNFPATPSLSVTLAGVSTTTSVRFGSDLEADRFVLDGQEEDSESLARVVTLLGRVRAASTEKRFAEVVSANDFPTASGLASSASGFAALAVAATRAAGLDWDAERTSDFARRSSASAARSLFGGYAELLAGADGADETTVLAASQVAPGDHLPMRVLVCVTTDAKKPLSSGAGMRATAANSPYYAAWVESAPKSFEEIRNSLMAKDFDRLGAAAESNALAMHASAIAANVVYWNGATIEALSAVKALRARGTSAYATIDAGPHVKVLVRPDDAALAGTWLRAVPGVVRVLECEPGEGARVVEGGESGDER